MPQITSESVIVPHERLQTFCEQCLTAIGLSERDAHLVAESLVESSLRGIDSHGVARLPHYLNRIQHGSIKTNPSVTFHKISPSLGRVDGDHGLGQVVMQKATDAARELATDIGSGWVTVENSSHCGALAYYGLQLARAGMIGFVFTHSDSMVAPYAAKHAFCGTNPICITVPGPEGHIPCLDMATSIVPWNTITNAAIEGVALPNNWALDKQGNPTTDPKSVSAVHPFGDYKGSGLGLMIDILCSFLLGSPYGPDIAAMYGDPTKQRLLGGLVGAIDVSRFGDAENFRTRIEALCRRWCAQPQADPDVPVLYPGQPEEITRKERLASGIPIGVKLNARFSELADEFNLCWEAAS